MAVYYIKEVKKPFLSAYEMGTTIPIPSVKDTIILEPNQNAVSFGFESANITITDSNNNTVTITDRAGISGEYTFQRNGQYAIRYFGVTYERYTIDPGTSPSPKPFSYTYYVSAVQNQYPLKRQTILDVVNRILRLAEPLVWDRKKGDYVKQPRFKFAYKYYDESKPYEENSQDGKNEFNLFNQTSPEFTFTRCTLREALQMVGQFIHAEPRLIDKETFIFDRYGEQDLATYERIMDGAITPFNQHPYKGKHFSHDIGVACTQVESDLDNFVNRLDGVGGTITEPFRGGAITLRSDTAYLRFEDSESLYFPTTRGIMDITDMYWVDLEGLAGTPNERYRITPYVFEKTAYDAELSSYETQYPRSKSYALYYTQGQKNIEGFFFKNEEWSGGVFANYAIVNILNQVTGKSLKSALEEKYPTLAFELTYTPMYGARVSHGKSYVGDMLKKPFALMYNQSSNIVETRYYGEHLKGVAERLGNVDKQVDIIVRNVGNIPRIGQMWDDDYYIATVKGSAVYDGVLLSIGLSKKFNRLSAYVGANSYKRYYEVSERMAQDRKMLYKDYLVITNREGGIMPSECCFGIRNYALRSVANTFYQVDDGFIQQIEDGQAGYTSLMDEIVNLAQCTGYGKNFTPNTSVYLPVTSSAFGNCMEFTWDFTDNYSAGVSSTYQTSSKTVGGKPTTVSGYFGAEVTYGDYYGRMYYQQWVLGQKPYGQDINLERALALPQAFKDVDGIKAFLGVSIDSYTNLYHVVDKDNREILSQGYSIEFVTDIKGVVIGSALSRNNPMIGGRITDKEGEPCYAEVYVLPNRVNQFSNDEIDFSGATLVSSFRHPPFSTSSNKNTAIKVISNYVAGTKGERYLHFDGVVSPVAGKAWAIVTRRYKGAPETVEGEDGEPEPLTPTYGGELLIAQNIDVAEGDVVGKFNIVPTHDVFEFMKQEV